MSSLSFSHLIARGSSDSGAGSSGNTLIEHAAHNESAVPWWTGWEPSKVYLLDDSVPASWKVCVLNGVYFGENEYNGYLGGRITAVFVIFITSLIVVLFPVAAQRIKWLRIPRWVYEISKNFGTGVILCTAFIHLMDPAYSSIGGNSCVGMTGGWSEYSWCPAIMLTAAVVTFLMDTYADFFAAQWFGVDLDHGVDEVENLFRDAHGSDEEGGSSKSLTNVGAGNSDAGDKPLYTVEANSVDSVERDFSSQISGFMILEFGVIFHSVMIGLTLGTSNEFPTLFVVLVFHQAFEGLGVGARLSMIQFPKRLAWMPWLFCVAYSLATPIAIAIGLGVRHSYRDGSFTAEVVQGVLDAISTGILLYTGFVELLARDFMFNPHRTKNVWVLTGNIFAFLWGAGLMALLGKWA